VESYALRRAAINLGDTFGLHLYRDGQITPLVRGTLQTTDPESPLYQVPKESAPAPRGDLTQQQMAALQNSLGAQIIDNGEQPTEVGVSGSGE
jgi:hypothetical protein